MNDDPSLETDAVTAYITSFYWVVTTLTTVGYGDYKGYTVFEYLFTYLIEFVGIVFFSIIKIYHDGIYQHYSRKHFNTDGDLDITDQKLESVDVWLVKLDNSRMSK